jgi:hypothetical protein
MDIYSELDKLIAEIKADIIQLNNELTDYEYSGGGWGGNGTHAGYAQRDILRVVLTKIERIRYGTVAESTR